MEAWLKFRAPGVSLTIGLGIGKLVFGALNKVELFLTAAILLGLWRLEERGSKDFFVLFPIAILVVQVFVLMPILDARANAYIQGKEVESYSVHLYYVIGEGLKMISLWWCGIWALRKVMN